MVPTWVQVGISVTGLFLSYQLVKSTTSRSKVQPPEARVKPGDHVLLLGDSLAEGLARPLRDVFIAHGATLHTRAVRGTSAAYWAKHTSPSDGGYDYVLVSLGTNDVRRANVLDERDELATMVSNLRSRGAEVGWVLPPSFRIGSFRPAEQAFAGMMAEVGVYPIEVQGPQQDVSQDPERVHLTPHGYAAYSGQLGDALLSPR